MLHNLELDDKSKHGTRSKRSPIMQKQHNVAVQMLASTTPCQRIVFTQPSYITLFTVHRNLTQQTQDVELMFV